MTMAPIALNIPPSHALQEVFAHYWPDTVMTYEALQAFCIAMFYTALQDATDAIAYDTGKRATLNPEAAPVFAAAVERRRR